MALEGYRQRRELDRLCGEHMAYKWLCGGVSVNYHMLSDFRSQGGEKWDELLTHIVAVLLDADLVKMDRVAQDGMRVRASAGKSSFRRQSRLEEFLEEAKQQVEELKQLAEEDGEALTRRQRAARERAARERQQASKRHCVNAMNCKSNAKKRRRRAAARWMKFGLRLPTPKHAP